MEFRVHQRDFVLDGPGLPGAGLFGSEAFDIAILNPPYLKIGKTSPYATALSDLVHGQPNLYALFMAVAAHHLRDGGEFVAITPRSFCNGPYFRVFRRWLTSQLSIERLHLFESRTEAFRESEVLQESLITYGRRVGAQSDSVRISSGDTVAEAHSVRMSPAEEVIVGADRVIRCAATELEARVVRAVESWPGRFETVGLRVSTGPVVLFRAEEFVRRGAATKGCVPLLAMHNVRPFRTVWPSERPERTMSFEVSDRSRHLLVPAGNYALIRRFSAKEEARRLVASPLLAGEFGDQPVALENHLNYVYGADRGLSFAEVLGVVGVLNSRLLDVYFRTISGNTQVNAAELRAMPFPDLDTLAAIGRRLRPTEPSVAAERVVLDTLAINGQIRKQLTEAKS